MLSFDPSTGSLTMPVWVSAIVLVALVVLIVFAIARAGASRIALALVGIAVLACAVWIASTLSERGTAAERTAQRRALEQRAQALAASARVPGTPLSCLAGMAGEQVEIACERAVFATPDSVAAAVTYVGAEVTLLADALAAAQRGDADYDRIIAPVRRGLEIDRYGIVAHVMLQRESCSADQCDTLDLLHDANRVRSNLRERPFNALVTKYAPGWANARLGPPVVSLGPSIPGAPTGVPVSSKYDFPSSASIPAVNIMGAEQATPPPGPPGAAPPTTATAPAATGGPPAAAAEATPAPQRRPARPPPRPPRATTSAPVQPPAQAAPAPEPPQ